MNQAEEPIALLPVPSNVKDITGQVFGRLTVLKRGVSKNGNICWDCQCECGSLSLVTSSHLRSGHTKSCGCLLAGKLVTLRKTHGETCGKKNTQEYSIWVSMRRRCLSRTNPAYPNYGGRGIKISQEWSSFSVFLADMGRKPFKGATLERLDNNRGYCRDNCVWASREDQSNNRRNTMKVFWQDKLVTVSDLAKETNKPRRLLYQRLKNGWSVEKAVRTPNRYL